MPALVLYRLILALGALVFGFIGVAAIADPGQIGQMTGIEAAGLVTGLGLGAMVLALISLFLAHREYA